MTMAQIIAVIAELAKSQGLYGRLLQDMKDMAIYRPDEYALVKADWEARQFKDAVDFILYIEG